MDIWEYIQTRSGEDLLIDLRGELLWKQGTIPGAVNIPMEQIQELFQLPKDRDIYVFCQSGGSSGEIAELLSGSGYNVCDLTGGYREYLRRSLAEFGKTGPETMEPGPVRDLTHFDRQGRAKMVDVGKKAPSHRTAIAGARVLVDRETFALIRSGGTKKGDVLATAQIAGIMGAKRTWELIPMCHPVQINGIELTLTMDGERCCIEIRAAVTCDGRTGVEMEALTAVSTAALTVYDMCKAVQRDIVITDIRLLEKTGGVHGDLHREGEAL